MSNKKTKKCNLRGYQIKIKKKKNVKSMLKGYLIKFN